jgi:hypothetical protein
LNLNYALVLRSGIGVAIDANDVLDEAQLADREQVPVATVRQWRRSRTGPRWYYAGRHPRYRGSDVLAWEAAQAEANEDRMDVRCTA